jgi:hypothetical protein
MNPNSVQKKIVREVLLRMESSMILALELSRKTMVIKLILILADLI